MKIGHGEGIFAVNEGKKWGHVGTISGFSTEMWYMPEKDATLVISVNRSDEQMDSHSRDGSLAVFRSPPYPRRSGPPRPFVHPS